jgi:uncharacterized protein YbjT (DUF2867 family)
MSRGALISVVMRILVLGGYGFIGSAVVARLSADGHEVVGAGRRIRRASRIRPDLRWIKINIARAGSVEKWLRHLKGIDAVVNCAGVLQDMPWDSTHKVHVEGTIALYSACVKMGVRRVVHISAVGIGPEEDTSFARTKFAAEQELKKLDLDWIILRPSLVVGRSIYGGMALLRALAALPFVVPLARESATFRPVQVTDLATAVSFFLKPEAPIHRVFEIAGPERLTLARIIAAYRRWFGLAPGEIIRLPLIGAKALAWLGDVGSWLGWRPPYRTTSLRQLSHSLTSEPDVWTKVTGIKPMPLETALRLEPASAQELWFARLYLLKPIIMGVLSLFWILDGAIGLGPGRTILVDLSREVGFGIWSTLAAVASGVLQVGLGIGIAIRATSHVALTASLLAALIYVAAGGLMRLGLWLDPLGSLLKMFPIIILTVVAIAIFDDR